MPTLRRNRRSQRLELVATMGIRLSRLHVLELGHAPQPAVQGGDVPSVGPSNRAPVRQIVSTYPPEVYRPRRGRPVMPCRRRPFWTPRKPIARLLRTGSRAQPAPARAEE